MPYIKEKNRVELKDRGPMTVGELNYCITTYCLEYLDAIKELTGVVPQYIHYNDIIGVLESAKLEFYRRAVSVYEDVCIASNGDIY